MKRPLVIVALFFAAGIVLDSLLHVPLRWLFTTAFLLLAASFAWSSARNRLAWPVVLLAGWIVSAGHTVPIHPFDLRTTTSGEPAIVTVRGILCETPTLRVYGDESAARPRTLARMDVLELGEKTAWKPASGRIAITTLGTLGANYFAGRSVEVSGVLKQPDAPSSPGQFDYRGYLKSLGIHRQMRVDGANDWKLLDGEHAAQSPPLTDRFRHWAQRTLSRGFPDNDPNILLLWTMVLGNKSSFTEETSEVFMRSGTLHIFAISGLHIALIAGILVSGLRALRVPREFCGAVVLPLIWFYTAATGWQSSAIRSTVMTSIVVAGWSLKRPSDLINSLFGAGLIILAWQPGQLFQAGFQLSFVVVFSIALLLPPIEQWLNQLLQPDPLLPSELRPAWQRWLDRPIRYLTANVAISVAAWLGSLPLIAYYFNIVSPVALGANLLVVPMSGFALMSSLGSLVCGDWFPALTEWFNHGAWFWMKGMVMASEWSAGLPAACFNVPTPPGHATIAGLVIIGLALSGRLRVQPRGKWLAIGCALSAAVSGWLWWRSVSGTHLIIPALSSSGIFIDEPGGASDLVIDSGDANDVEFILKPLLRSSGVNRIPHLLLTHGDTKHVSGFEALDRLFPVQKVITSSQPSRSPAYNQVLRRLTEGNSNRREQIARGDILNGWTVLHPAATDRFTRADDNAVVLARTIHGARVLLLSDLGRAGQNALLEREPDLRADIVVTGLPASEEPLGNALIERLQPRLVVVATAEHGYGSGISRKLRERLERWPVPVLYTQDAGAVILRFQPQGWTYRTMGSGSATTRVPSPMAKSEPEHE